MSHVSNHFSDLKCLNVGFTESGIAKLFDFGLSREIKEAVVLPNSTYIYDSPEIINKIPITTSADWWALGCLVAETIQKFEAFGTKKNGNKYIYWTSLQLLQQQILHEPPELLIEDPIAKDFIEKLLEKDPEKRLQDVFSHEFLNVKNEPIFKPGNIILKTVGNINMQGGDQEFGTTKKGKKDICDNLLLRFPSKKLFK